MKTIDLTKKRTSVGALLKSAQSGAVLVKATNGRRFLVSAADEFASEVELLRKNHAFLAFLDKCKKDKRRVPLEEAERRLR